MMPANRTHRRFLTLLFAGTIAGGVLVCFTLAGSPGDSKTLAAPNGTSAPAPSAAPFKIEGFWQVDDVRPGMKGIGKTVLKGTKVETFHAEVIGVLRHTSPGRDMILCRLSGLDLERTGVIAGMSGSPVYVENKLLGAVAYGWAYGKDPIAGITPFVQMHGYAEAFERRDLAEENKSRRTGHKHTLPGPVQVGTRLYDSVSVAQDASEVGREGDELLMRPLETPLAATGFSANSLQLLRGKTPGMGLVPMQSGGAGAKVVEAEKNVPLENGGPLVVTLVRGDFDLSGVGTVTHIEGTRVYGWGHPFQSLGACEFPLMTGFIHTVYPRQSVSFKMGSPLRTVGVINADVSTGIAGWLDKKPDLLPVRMSITKGPDGPTRTYNVEVVRQKTMMPSLVYTSLTNSVDHEGELPEEMTADFLARIELEDREPLVIKDTFSGFSGGRAPQALYSQVASALSLLVNNPYEPVRVTKVEVETFIHPGRRSADIDAVEIDSEVYQPGDTVRATVYLRPWKGQRIRVPVELKLPTDVAEGRYTATILDDVSALRQEIRDNPVLNSPENVSQILDTARLQLSAKRSNLVVRVPLGATGVTLEDRALPQLPGSMVQILGGSRRTGAQTMSSSLVSRKATDWIIQGQETFSFQVARDKKLTLAR